MAKIQKFFGETQGNKSLYESELFRKILQTLEGKDLTEASILRVRPEVILSYTNCHSTGDEWCRKCLSLFSFHFCPFI